MIYINKFFWLNNQILDFKIRVQFTRYSADSIRIISYSLYEQFRIHKSIVIETSAYRCYLIWRIWCYLIFRISISFHLEIWVDARSTLHECDSIFTICMINFNNVQSHVKCESFSKDVQVKFNNLKNQSKQFEMSLNNLKDQFEQLEESIWTTWKINFNNLQNQSEQHEGSISTTCRINYNNMQK